MRFHTSRLAGALLVGTAAIAFAAPAAAQSQQDTVASQDAEDEVIVVTARRREERLLDGPVAVSGFSGEALEERGALDITDVAPGEVETGLPVKMVFRIKDRDEKRGVVRYVWKAAPDRSAAAATSAQAAE